MGKRTWTAAQLALLGKLSDSEVGRRTGRKKLTVQKQRQRLGIMCAEFIQQRTGLSPKEHYEAMISEKAIEMQRAAPLSCVNLNRFTNSIVAHSIAVHNTTMNGHKMPNCGRLACLGGFTNSSIKLLPYKNACCANPQFTPQCHTSVTGWP